jgi:hypothetical protein
MKGPIETWFGADHQRLEALLARALARGAGIDPAPYAEFREGLLRHIAMEEKILLPAAKRARGGEALPSARRLRVDHGAIASLLVPFPTPAIAAEIRSILGPHNLIEEERGGLYETCDRLLAGEAAQIVERAAAYPPVKVAPHREGPGVCHTAAEALEVSARQR